MPYYVIKISATGPDGAAYRCTLFDESADEPALGKVLDGLQLREPRFVNLQVDSVRAISAEEYARLVRQMSDSDEWGFRRVE